MMDIEKLIEQLNARGLSNGSSMGYHCGLYDEAATALSTLQAENAEMQQQLNEFSEFLCYMTGGLLSKTNYMAQEMVTAAEDYQQKVCGECDLRVENEKLLAELERKNEALDFARTKDAEIVRLGTELERVKRENNALWTYIEIVDREYRRYMDRGYIDRLDELKKVWRRGQKEG